MTCVLTCIFLITVRCSSDNDTLKAFAAEQNACASPGTDAFVAGAKDLLDEETIADGREELLRAAYSVLACETALLPTNSTFVSWEAVSGCSEAAGTFPVVELRAGQTHPIDFPQGRCE